MFSPSSTRRLPVMGLLASLGVQFAASAQPIEGMWERTFAPSRLSSFAAHDPDGPGPEPARLYALGGPTGFVRWDGSHWESLPGAPSATLLTVIDLDGTGEAPMLMAAGEAPAIHVWDGQSWQVFGEVWFSGYASGLAAFDLDGPGPSPRTLVARGDIRPLGSTNTSPFVSWTGGEWRPFGAEPSPQNRIAFENLVEATWQGGTSLFTVAPFWQGCDEFDGEHGIVVWTGTRWRELDCVDARDHSYQHMTSFDPDGLGSLPLLAHGRVRADVDNYLLRFDPSRNRFNDIPGWFPLGSLSAGPIAWNHADLHLTAVCGSAGDTHNPYPLHMRSGVAAWDGGSWRRVGPVGQIRTATALGTLVDGGTEVLFVSALVQPTNIEDVLVFNPNRCTADCDTSTGAGVLDVFDFLCFGNAFARREPYACNCDVSTGVGVCDILDYICFQNLFAQCSK